MKDVMVLAPVSSGSMKPKDCHTRAPAAVRGQLRAAPRV